MDYSSQNMTTSNKRTRAKNFTKEDKEILYRSIKKHFHIIENKQTDKVFSKAKSDRWDIIAQEFNALSLEKAVNSKQLRMFYDNWKRKIKEGRALERCELKKTGGGPPHETVLDNIDWLLYDLIKAQVEPLNNPFDSDAKRLKRSPPAKVEFEGAPKPSLPPQREVESIDFAFPELSEILEITPEISETPTQGEGEEKIHIVTVNMTPTRTRKLHSITSPQKVYSITSPKKVYSNTSPQKFHSNTPPQKHISERDLNASTTKSTKVYKKKTPSKKDHSVMREEMPTPMKESTAIREEILSVTKLRANTIKTEQEARKEIHDLEVLLLKKKYENMSKEHELTMQVLKQQHDNEEMRKVLLEKQIKQY